MRRTFLSSKTEPRRGGGWYIPHLRKLERVCRGRQRGRILPPGVGEVKRNRKSPERRVGAFLVLLSGRATRRRNRRNDELADKHQEFKGLGRRFCDRRMVRPR